MCSARNVTFQCNAIEDGDEMPENSEAGMYENGGHMLFVIY